MWLKIWSILFLLAMARALLNIFFIRDRKRIPQDVFWTLFMAGAVWYASYQS